MKQSVDRRPPTAEGTSHGGQQPSVQMYIDSKTPVLLQTTTTPVYSNPPQSVVQTRLVLDSGSRGSYITNQLRDMPLLRTVLIKTFGSSVEKIQEFDLVHVWIGARSGGSAKVNALIVPVICERICGQPINCAEQTFEHLSGLDSAGSSHSGVTL